MLMVQNLYNMNVKKVVVMGMPPIGCAPHYLWKYSSKNGECVDEINDMIMEYNFVMRFMIEELGHELLDAKITFCDMYEGSMDIIKNHEHYGKISKHFSPFCHQTIHKAFISTLYYALIQVLMSLLMLAAG